MEHTKGPWKASPTLRIDLDDDPMGEYTIQPIKDLLTKRYLEAEPETPGLDTVHKENLSNAILISAAPDLLEACQAVLEWARTPGDHGGNPYCKKFVMLAEKAIKKAGGRE